MPHFSRWTSKIRLTGYPASSSRNLLMFAHLVTESRSYIQCHQEINLKIQYYNIISSDETIWLYIIFFLLIYESGVYTNCRYMQCLLCRIQWCCMSTMLSVVFIVWRIWNYNIVPSRNASIKTRNDLSSLPDLSPIAQTLSNFKAANSDITTISPAITNANFSMLFRLNVERNDIKQLNLSMFSSWPNLAFLHIDFNFWSKHWSICLQGRI